MAQRIEEERPDKDVPYCHDDKVDAQRVQEYRSWSLGGHA